MGKYIAKHRNTGNETITVEECLSTEAEMDLEGMGGDEANVSMTQFGIDLTQFKQAEGNLFSINGGSVNAAAKRPWIIGESGEELAPPKRTKISEEILTNELNSNNATKTD